MKRKRIEINLSQLSHEGRMAAIDAIVSVRAAAPQLAGIAQSAQDMFTSLVSAPTWRLAERCDTPKVAQPEGWTVTPEISYDTPIKGEWNND